jgi:WD repeat-containing protein 61
MITCLRPIFMQSVKLTEAGTSGIRSSQLMDSPLPPTLFTGHKGPVYALEDLKDAFISGSGDGLVVRWQVDRPDQGEVLAKVDQAIFSMAFDTGDHRLFIGTEGGDLHVVDARDRREIQLLRVHRKGVFRILLLANGRIACAGGDGTLSIWENGPDGRLALYRHVPLSEEKLRDLHAPPDGRTLLVASGDGRIYRLDGDLFNELDSWMAHPGTDVAGATGCSSLAMHPQKPVLISGGKDGHLRFWKSDDAYEPAWSIAAHRGSIYRIAFSPDGTLCATASRDKTIKIWSATTFDPAHRLDRIKGGHTHSVNALIWHGKTLVSAGDDRAIKAWPVL